MTREDTFERQTDKTVKIMFYRCVCITHIYAAYMRNFPSRYVDTECWRSKKFGNCISFDINFDTNTHLELTKVGIDITCDTRANLKSKFGG